MNELSCAHTTKRTNLKTHYAERKKPDTKDYMRFDFKLNKTLKDPERLCTDPGVFLLSKFSVILRKDDRRRVVGGGTRHSGVASPGDGS